MNELSWIVTLILSIEARKKANNIELVDDLINVIENQLDALYQTKEKLTNM